MGLCDTLKVMAEKLHLSEHEMLLLYMGHFDVPQALMRMRVNDLVLMVVAHCGLKDLPFEKGLGAQLVEKGILTLEEAELFSTGRIPPEAA